MLALFAHAPVLSAGWFAWDRAAFLGDAAPARAWSLAARFVREPIGADASAFPLRLEAWLALLALALALRAFMARLLEPWLGAQPAHTAALVGALLLPLHPAVPSAVAELAGGGELRALLLALVAGTLFLRGRHEERDAFTIAAFALLVVAAFASPVAVLFAGAFACTEYASVRRHRRRSLRLRTAATTALVFGAGAWLPVALRAPRSAVAGGAALAAADGARERVLALASELGRVAAAPERLGIPGALLAGAIVLVALAPVLRAARHAPRLWSWILAAWAAALAASLAWASSSATEWSSPRGLLAASVWSAGLGLALGTLARPWRAVVVALVACAWAVLAHASARPWAEGTRVLASFRGELAAQALPEGTHVLVLDPPRVDGLPPFSRALGWLLRERRDQDADAPRFDPRALQGLTSAAFLVLSRSPAFERLRASGVVVLVPRRAVGEERGGWQPVALAAARAKAPLLKPWRGGLTHVFDDPIDPFEVEEVRVAADLVVAPRELAELGWRTVAGGSGTAPAFLCEQGGRRVADFDLAGSLAWRLADPVRRLIVEKGERDVEGVEFLARSRELPGQGPPEVAGADWCFARPALAGEERGGSLVLAMLALDELELVELPLEPASSDPAGALCARGAQRYAARASARGATLAWELEYRIGPHALYRTRGIVP